MKKICMLLSLALSLNAVLLSQTIPEGYILQYHQDFIQKKSLEDFRFSIPGNYQIKTGKGINYLQMSPVDPNDSVVFVQKNMFIIDNHIFGDFILEAGIRCSGTSSDPVLHLYFGIKDSLNYYNLILVPGDGIKDNVMNALVKGRNKEIDAKINGTIELIPGKWHKIRVERDIVATSVKLFFDDMKTPYIEIVDRTFIMGYIGFGPEIVPVGLSNIKIWSQTSIPEPARFFSR